MRSVALLLFGVLIGVSLSASFIFYTVSVDPSVSFRLARLVQSINSQPNINLTPGKEASSPAGPAPGGVNSQDGPQDISFRSMDELLVTTDAVLKNPSAVAYADILQEIEVSNFDESQVAQVEKLEADLVDRLRKQVKNELEIWHRQALDAANYQDASQEVAKAASILALYPMADDPQILKEAEALSQRQNDVRFRVDSIRRARYNGWAATTIEESLKTLREEAENYLETSLGQLAQVESSLLDPATSALYGYAVQQLMDEYKNSEKARVAKALNDPSFSRRTLEGF